MLKNYFFSLLLSLVFVFILFLLSLDKVTADHKTIQYIDGNWTFYITNRDEPPSILSTFDASLKKLNGTSMGDPVQIDVYNLEFLHDNLLLEKYTSDICFSFVNFSKLNPLFVRSEYGEKIEFLAWQGQGFCNENLISIEGNLNVNNFYYAKDHEIAESISGPIWARFNNGNPESLMVEAFRKGCMTDIWISAFLPPYSNDGRIPNPVPFPTGNTSGTFDFLYHSFGTDNRNEPKKMDSARIWNYFIIDLCEYSDFVKFHKSGIGQSHGYKNEIRDGKHIEAEYTARADKSGLDYGFKVLSNGTYSIHVKSEVSNPLMKFAPDIDYELTINLDYIKNTNLINYSLYGSHDGFPAYEVFIGNTNIYFHTPKIQEGQHPLDPFNRGQTIASLFPPMEFNVTEKGTVTIDSSNLNKNLLSPTLVDSHFVDGQPLQFSKKVRDLE